MNQNRKKGKAQGSVLFTVVTVMMIMVVFLMSTLILTTAAHKRSYYSYYETQAQYAAQAALDAVTSYAYSDAGFSEWVQGITDDDPHEFYVQFDGTTLPLSDTSIAGEEDYVVCQVQRDKPNYVWDDVTNAIRRTEGWKISATAFVGHGRNQASYTMVNYIYANIKTDQGAGVQNRLTFNTTTWDQQSGIDPSTIEDDPGDEGDSILPNAVYTLSTMNTGSEGNLMILGPQYSGMSDLPVGRINYNNSNTPSTSFSNNNAAVGSSMYINNMTSSVEMQVTFQKPGENMKIFGNVSATNTNGLVVNAILNEPTNNYSKLNYVYIDGTLIGGNSGYSFGMGTGSSPVNLFAGAIDAQGNRTVAVNGDIYLYDPDLVSKIGANGSGATILSTFLTNNIEGKNSTTNEKLGNLICNNKKLTLGNGASTTIAGDLYYTNPAGSVEISGNVTVNGKVYFACGQDKVSNYGNITCTNGITYNATSVAGYGANYPSDYTSKIPGTGYDYRLFPFSYRLDEIFKKYYRWDLAGNDDWADDALIKESVAAGHTWNTEKFYAGVAQGSSPYIEEILTVAEAEARLKTYGDGNANASWQSDSVKAALNEAGIVLGTQYWDGDRNSNVISWKTENPDYDPDDVTEIWVDVPYTTPSNAANAFMDPFQPIDSRTAGGVVNSAGGKSELGIDTYADFIGRYGTAATTVYKNGSMPEKKNVTYFYAVDDTDVLGYKTEDVYFINESCTINVDNLSGTIIIDETSAGAPLGIVLEGEFSNDLKILTNNTAKYTTDGNVLSVYGPTDYEQTITVNGTDTTVKGNGAYAGRTEVLFFLKSGFGTAEKDTTNNMNLIISTGMYDAATKKVFDIVSNPVYPGKDAYADLNGAGDGEMWKFMLVPNSVMFGQVNTNYALANIFVSSVMLMSSSTVSRGGMYYAIASGNIKYREEHSSIAYVGTFTDQNGNASSKNFMCAGMMLVSSVGVKNLPMVAYIGDANRPGSSNTNPGKEYDPAATSSDDQGATNDPNASDGKDYFSNDHLGAS